MELPAFPNTKCEPNIICCPCKFIGEHSRDRLRGRNRDKQAKIFERTQRGYLAI